ncbi:hypothetical protein C8J57DRAFT_1244505 [Mycena rebaudengoi]|nr:hypothetical protein C8J57DRAFT_1244505 [Mycena rebaudengoi]
MDVDPPAQLHPQRSTTTTILGSFLGRGRPHNSSQGHIDIPANANNAIGVAIRDLSPSPPGAMLPSPGLQSPNAPNAHNSNAGGSARRRAQQPVSAIGMGMSGAGLSGMLRRKHSAGALVGTAGSAPTPGVPAPMPLPPSTTAVPLPVSPAVTANNTANAPPAPRPTPRLAQEPKHRVAPAPDQGRGYSAGLGVDYQGSTEDIYKSVKIRIEGRRERVQAACPMDDDGLRRRSFGVTRLGLRVRRGTVVGGSVCCGAGANGSSASAVVAFGLRALAGPEVYMAHSVTVDSEPVSSEDDPDGSSFNIIQKLLLTLKIVELLRTIVQGECNTGLYLLSFGRQSCRKFGQSRGKVEPQLSTFDCVGERRQSSAQRCVR